MWYVPKPLQGVEKYQLVKTTVGVGLPIVLPQEIKNNNQQQAVPLLDCAAGLAELASKKYKEAAKHFLKCQFDNCDFPEVSTSRSLQDKHLYSL